MRVETISAFIAVDADGTEGIIGMQISDGTFMPFVAADEQRLISLRPLAVKIAKEGGISVRLARFSIRENLLIICHKCGMTSTNPTDVDEGYCGFCKDWTGNGG